jgi:hypothetical protein
MLAIGVAWILCTRDGMPAWHADLEAESYKAEDLDYEISRNDEEAWARMLSAQDEWSATPTRWRLVVPEPMRKMHNSWEVKCEVFREALEEGQPDFGLVFNGEPLPASPENRREKEAIIPVDRIRPEQNVLELWTDQPGALRRLRVKNFSGRHSWFPTFCTVRLDQPYYRRAGALGLPALIAVLLIVGGALLWLNHVCLSHRGQPLWSPSGWLRVLLPPVGCMLALSAWNLFAPSKVLFAHWSAVLFLMAYLGVVGGWRVWKLLVTDRWEEFAEEEKARWRERRCVLLLFLLFWVVYNSNLSRVGEIDGLPAPRQAISILRHGDMNLDEYPGLHRKKKASHRPVVETRNGHWVSRWTPGSGLFCVPFAALPVMLGVDETPSRTICILAKVAASTITALSAILVYLCLRHFVSRKGAAWLTVAYALGTASFSMSSQDMWQHGPVQLCLAGALYIVLSGRKHWGWYLLTGLCLGLVVLTRPPAIVLTVPIGLWAARRHNLKVWAWYAIGAFPPVLFLVAYNMYYFGTPALVGYSNVIGGGWTPGNMPAAFAGLLISPNRGLLVYSPFLLIIPYCLYRAFRHADRSYRWLAALCLGAIVAQFLLISAWKSWHALFSFGCRYSADSLVYWALLAGFGIDRILAVRPWRYVFYTLVGISIFIQSLGVYVDTDHWHWHEVSRRHVDPEHFDAAAWDVDKPQILWQIKELLGLDPGDY